MSFKFGVFTFDLATKFMDVDSGITELDAQEIYNATKEWGEQPANMIYDTIATGGGKFALNQAKTRFTGLVVRMDAVDSPGPTAVPWAVKFADAPGPAIELRRVTGGDFISDGDPVAPSANVYIVIEQATSPTLVVTGGGLAAGDKTDIAVESAQKVWGMSTTAGGAGNGTMGEMIVKKLLSVVKYLSLK